MERGLFTIGKNASTFHDHVDIDRSPWQLRRIAFCKPFDGAESDIEVVGAYLDFAWKPPVDGVVFQEMNVRLHIAEIVDRHHGEVFAIVFGNRPEHVAANTAKAVDCYPDSHGVSSAGNEVCAFRILSALHLISAAEKRKRQALQP